MRYLLAALALTVIAVRTTEPEAGEISNLSGLSGPSESQKRKNQDLVAQKLALISSGKIIQFDPKDHPPAVDGKIVGTE
jgi:hypothetical protein